MSGAFIGVLVGVVIIAVCVILMLVKCRSKKGFRIHDQGGAAFGNAVYDGGTVLYSLGVVTIKSGYNGKMTCCSTD